MDLPALYEEDMYAWCLHQAEVLRRLQASGMPLPNDLDLEHVAEEIEDLGNEQRFQVEGNLEQALSHLIKLVLLPDDQATRHWLKEIAVFLTNARRRYRRSMNRAIDPQKLWVAGCRAASLDFDADGRDLPPLPHAMPFDLAELLDPAATPRALAARLAASIDPA